ncbi:glycosyl transferase family 2 [Paraconexibacter algicola]|uniref:Glycosyl transferase family 2 n=1 Tax=Paraconexibacter algicola TaxID=2133960 RepID=A0A2T4UIN9_9ACTN|nr:glycosyl transferase family 2 [Paraconexibacter algicola]
MIRSVPVDLVFCVVNTNGRELLLRGLDAIAREQAAGGFTSRVLVLDNASVDGSADAARAHPAVDEVLALDRRTGKAQNDSTLLRRAHEDGARHGLLLNEDSELRPGAVRALLAALDADPRAGAAGAALLRPDGATQAAAWRFPGLGTAVASALLLHRRLVVQGDGTTPTTRRVDWAQSACLLVRTEAAAQVGYLDPDFFVYSDEVDFARRLADAGWHSLFVPGAVCVHHEQLSTGSVPERRIVEMARGRDRYLRKHHGTATALVVRALTALPYALRTVAALVLPGHDARRYARHVTATLRPGRGEGLREAAEAFNATVADGRDAR